MRPLLTFRPFLLLLLLLAHAPALEPVAPVPYGKPEKYPSWWFERGVICQTATPAQADPTYPDDYLPPDDYAALNQGQLKHLATAARDELLAEAPTNFPELTAKLVTFNSLVQNWFTLDAQNNPVPKTGGSIDSYAVVNQGQLKTVAKALHECLIALKYEDALPWAANASPDPYAVANTGQAKNLFSFDLHNDRDADGIEDWRERLVYHTDPDNPDSDGDGLSDGFEVGPGDGSGTDPTKDDTDGDGVPDALDAYPKDPRRSRDIPVIHYTAIPLETLLGRSVSDAAITDHNDIIYWSLNLNDPGEWELRKWSGGTDVRLGGFQSWREHMDGHRDVNYGPLFALPDESGLAQMGTETSDGSVLSTFSIPSAARPEPPGDTDSAPTFLPYAPGSAGQFAAGARSADDWTGVDINTFVGPNKFPLAFWHGGDDYEVVEDFFDIQFGAANNSYLGVRSTFPDASSPFLAATSDGVNFINYGTLLNPPPMAFGYGWLYGVKNDPTAGWIPILRNGTADVPLLPLLPAEFQKQVTVDDYAYADTLILAPGSLLFHGRIASGLGTDEWRQATLFFQGSFSAPSSSAQLREVILPLGSNIPTAFRHANGHGVMLDFTNSATPKLLMPADIVIRKKGTIVAPSDGLVLKQGDVLEIALTPDYFNQPNQFTTKISWEYSQLKGDGTHTAWASLGTAGGTKVEFTTVNAGIFKLRAHMAGSDDVPDFIRKKDAPYAVNRNNAYNETLRAGKPDYFGVVENDTQLNVRNKAVSWLGKTTYAKSAYIKTDPDPDLTVFNPNTKNSPKCNIFVTHVANSVGATTPFWYRNKYRLRVVSAPLAKEDWYSEPEANIDLDQPGWKFKNLPLNPQPGQAIASPMTEPGSTTNGHVGILDYDGAWINAGEFMVNKSLHLTDPVSKGYKPNTIRAR